MNLSVVICTHNPWRDYLERTLKALQGQTLPADGWELVVVDNASTPPLANSLDLSWHSPSRIVSEPELGILPARVRGLSETIAPLILFVDDDNVLAPDYLEQGAGCRRQAPVSRGLGRQHRAGIRDPAASLGGRLSSLAGLRGGPC